jgi:hypothetical protein
MANKKEKVTGENDASFDLDMIQVGNVVAVVWYDAHSYERIEMSEIAELDEPEATRCWGAVVRKGRRYLFIASEIGDSESDGAWIEALPYRMIETCEVIGKTKIDEI